MNLKNIWFILLAFFVTLVPIKICSEFFNFALVGTSTFVIIFAAALLTAIIISATSKIKIQNMELEQNILLGIVSLLICATFFWCIPEYFNDTSKYDFEWQPLLMSILSILCCITFILTALTFFTGKNIVAKASFFLFCPVLWFSLDMILFLSIYNNNANIYEVLLTAFLSLYLIYHTQVFSTSSKANIVRLMFVFGIPTIVLAFAERVPVLIKYFSGVEVTGVLAATSVLEILFSVYVLLTLIQSYVQITAPKEPEVRSITIK